MGYNQEYMSSSQIKIQIPLIVTALLYSITVVNATFCLAQNKYRQIDRLALNTPDSAEQNIRSLVSYFDRDSLSNRAKVRALYRWSTDKIEYDIDAYLTNWPSSANPGTVFRRKKAQCNGYTSLLCEMVEKLDIPCKRIEGYAKSFNSFSIDTLSNNDKHAWNAIYLDGQWWLTDVTWSVGTYDSGTRKFNKKFNDGYFLVEPEQFIYTHFPFKSEHQFLPKQVKFKQFTNFPSVNRYFYDYDIAFLNLPKGEINVSKKHHISISIPSSIKIGALLEPAEYGLNGYYAESDDTFNKIYSKGLNLKLTKSGDRLQVNMKFHEKRRYSLYLFGRVKKESAKKFRPIAILNINNLEATSLENYHLE